MTQDLTDKVVLITGAASGMGRAEAHLFADEGATVAVTDLHRDAVDQVVAEIDEVGGSARGYVLDVGDAAAIEAVTAAIRAELGAIDILVNNAGVAVGGPVEDPTAGGTGNSWEDQGERHRRQAIRKRRRRQTENCVNISGINRTDKQKRCYQDACAQGNECQPGGDHDHQNIGGETDRRIDPHFKHRDDDDHAGDGAARQCL